MNDHLPRKQWAAQRSALRERLLEERKHSFQKGKAYTCPECGARKLIGSHALRRRLETPGYVLEASNLHGAQCEACGATVLEAFEELILEQEGQHLWRSHHTATVSRVSGQKLGMYFPKDVIESMDLHPKDVLALSILDEDTFVVHRRHASSEAS